MSPLTLRLEKRAAKFLRRLPAKQAQQISRKLLSLLTDPHPHDSAKLKGYPALRTDVGEYRIVYTVEKNELLVLVIGKRNDDEVYRQVARLS